MCNFKRPGFALYFILCEIVWLRLHNRKQRMFSVLKTEHLLIIMATLRVVMHI
jgi:hypothetical protein